ncbi:MAG: universal stress protein [Limisphaerales bacterium]
MNPPGILWQRILVTTDFSTASLAAVRYARALAHERNAGLTVLNIVEPFHVDWKMDTSDRQRDDRAEAERAMAAFSDAELRGLAGVHTVLRPGQPAEAIAEFARVMAADLLVIATHGRTSLARSLMGSVTENVVRHAPCPVLVIRTDPDRLSPRHALVTR